MRLWGWEGIGIRCVPNQCVAERDNASFGQCILWTMLPLDIASFGQCVRCRLHRASFCFELQAWLNQLGRDTSFRDVSSKWKHRPGANRYITVFYTDDLCLRVSPFIRYPDISQYKILPLSHSSLCLEGSVPACVRGGGEAATISEAPNCLNSLVPHAVVPILALPVKRNRPQILCTALPPALPPDLRWNR